MANDRPADISATLTLQASCDDSGVCRCWRVFSLGNDNSLNNFQYYYYLTAYGKLAMVTSAQGLRVTPLHAELPSVLEVNRQRKKKPTGSQI